MPLRLHESLSRSVRELKPAQPDGVFRFYNCGPTVYAASHIGNFRSFVVNDVIRRLLELEFPGKVKHDRNLTDVDAHAWDSPWGRGRLGWDIECSAMSKKHLGETIDLHTGGVDLLFPHHENEIAQSQCCNGKLFAHHWYHSEHLLVDGKKMSKSLGNLYTLDELTAKGFSPMAVRVALLAGHPRH